MKRMKSVIDIEIEEATEENLDEILEIERLSFSEPWSRETFSAELSENDFSTIILARAKKRNIYPGILGYCCYWVVSSEIHITNMAVHHQYRRKGIANQLMHHVIDEAEGTETELLTLEVRMSNTNAQNLYEKFGFHPIAVRKKYYPDHEDALIMLLKLEK
jgi:[ribosomal protein S18]-alanine N-acetyltransferase